MKIRLTSSASGLAILLEIMPEKMHRTSLIIWNGLFMKMQKKTVLLSAMALTTALITSGMATAADGSITINGEITAQTCQINGNGGGKDFVVNLPTVMANALNADGTTAGRTPFYIELTNCTPDSGNATVYFEPDALVDTNTGRLQNSEAAGAKNVQIGILNADYSEVKLGAVRGSQNGQLVPIAGGSATLNYYAQYVATGGAATSGIVTTRSMYSIVYQ